MYQGADEAESDMPRETDDRLSADFARKAVEQLNAEFATKADDPLGPDSESKADVPLGPDSENKADDPLGPDNLFATLDDLFGADLARLVAERDEYLDSLRRLQADFDNYRKRAIRQQTDLLDRASEGLLIQLLPVLDVIDLAEAHSSPEGDADDAAISQIGTLLRETLRREGLERIDEVGVPFDPTVHDAVAHEDDDGEGEGDDDGTAGHGPTVSEVMRAGYSLRGRVVRPAMVKVKG
ncbi:MAG: nucleotide exchange factor GrpE [Acidimicrobiales bacterium]